MLEKLINTVHHIHNTTSLHERLFAGQQSSLTLRSLYANALGLQHYSINSLLYWQTVQDKYITLHRELITQLTIYATSIRILAKGYLLISFDCPFKIERNSQWCQICCKEDESRLWFSDRQNSSILQHAISHFGIHKNKNLIVQFPVFIQQYHNSQWYY